MEERAVVSSNLTSFSKFKFGLKELVGGLIFLTFAMIAACLINHFIFGSKIAEPGMIIPILLATLLTLPFGIYSTRRILLNTSDFNIFREGMIVPSLSGISAFALQGLAIGFFDTRLDMAVVLLGFGFGIMFGFIGLLFTFWILFPCGWTAAIIIKLLLTESKQVYKGM